MSASGAASYAVPLQPATGHFGMTQSAPGHTLPQTQNQVAGMLPSDMMHKDDMIGDGGELQQNVDVQQPLLAINWDTLGQSEVDLPATFAGASSNQHVPPLVLNLATLGQSEIVMPGDETDMVVAVVTESAAVQVAGSRLPRRGQSVFNLDTDRSETVDLDPDPTRVGPGAGVDAHITAGGMVSTSLSTYSGRQQASGQGPGPGGGAHGYPDRQLDASAYDDDPMGMDRTAGSAAIPGPGLRATIGKTNRRTRKPGNRRKNQPIDHSHLEGTNTTEGGGPREC